MNDNEQLVKEFLIESYENLDQLDRDLVDLEKDRHDRDKLASIFRTIHTINGTCGFFGFSHLEAVTHVGENLLGKLRDGILELNPEKTGTLLAMVNAIRAMLANIEASNQEGERDDSALIADLIRLQEPPKEEDRPVKKPIGEILVETGFADQKQIQEALRLQAKGDSRQLGQILVDQKILQSKEVTQALKIQQEIAATANSENNIRVDVGLLDKLTNLVGELVLTRNQILQFMTSQRDSAFLNTAQKLNLITTELQEGLRKSLDDRVRAG